MRTRFTPSSRWAREYIRAKISLIFGTGGNSGPLWKLQAAPFVHVSFWISAGVVGGGAVLYARLTSYAQALFFELFHQHPFWAAGAMPLLFLVAVGLVVKLAPQARGSGIPQVLRVISDARTKSSEAEKNPMVSLRTALVKTLSTAAGILGGASVGREGPTVQLASSAFAQIGRLARRHVPQIEINSYLIAGAAGGVAAAFNTPLAGVTFALEEIAEDAFGQFKHFVMVTVIVAGIAAQGLAGDYLYFGHPKTVPPSLALVPATLLIGVAGGLFGGLFARLLSFPVFSVLPKHWALRALSCGVVCAGLALLTDGQTAGSGYEVTREFMNGERATLPMYFAPAKLAATVFSYLSEMAGGIFAPALSIGAGLGATLGQLAGFHNLRACGLIGMAAFFTGAVQTPLTAVIIVMEMTDEHILILPLMAAALLAQGIARRMMPVPLYRFLADKMGSKTEGLVS